MLNELEFIWDYDDYVWHKNYDEVKKYIAVNKTNKIIAKGKYVKLYDWILRQGQKYSNNDLSEEKINKLIDIGFLNNLN